MYWVHTILNLDVSSHFCQEGALVSFDSLELQDRNMAEKKAADKMREDDSV